LAESRTLPDRLRQTREVSGEEILYRFANGLVIRTEVMHKDDTLRILPLGSPQGSLMNHLASFPETVRDRRVFEPFAGSGALGLMALATGAQHVTFLDINPRAKAFHRANAEASGLSADGVRSFTGDIASFTPERPFDLLLANPPFVPTPDALDGTLTSNGGPEGSRFVEILLDRLDALLEPAGRALIYVFQLVRNGRPLIAERLDALDRPVWVTPSQARAIPLEDYGKAYDVLFPRATAATRAWMAERVRRHGEGLALSHYVVEIGPRSPEEAGCVLRGDFAERFGAAFLVPSENVAELALGRVFENFVPTRDG
jgi:hypothetical protein